MATSNPNQNPRHSSYLMATVLTDTFLPEEGTLICGFPRESTFGQTFSCGQCMACRINRQRQWVARLMLEYAEHLEASFLTLTYANEHLPCMPDGRGTLNPEHLQLWLKRLRKQLGRDRIRYFAVGEYGGRTQRPHYHVIVFGVGPALLEELAGKTWKYGFIKADELNAERMAYTAQYCLKKMTKKEDIRLDGREPEFSRMSRNPGIGYNGLKRLTAMHETKQGSRVLQERGDVLRTIRVEGRVLPLDRYVLEKLREALGLPRLAADRPKYVKHVSTPEELEEARKRHDKALRMFRQKQRKEM